MRKRLWIPAVLLILAGLVVLLYPWAAAWWEGSQRIREIEQFQMVVQSAELETAPVQSTEGASQEIPEAAASTEQEPTVQERAFSQLYADMEAYNQMIYETGQSGLVDAWSYEQPVFYLQDYGVESEIVGYLDIPAMEQRLPVYLGASMENLGRGVAVLGQTSMPIGGENTNCVIAGHRGNGADDLFREIELLKPGDTVALTNLWETLTYTVESTKIITPDQLDEIKLQSGREMLTLVTCHPRVGATHRYLVFCTRDVPEVSQEEKPDLPLETVEVAGPESQIQTMGNSVSEETVLAQAEAKSERIAVLEQWLPYLSIPLCAVALCLLLPRRRR